MDIDEIKLKWQNSKLFDKMVEDVVTKKMLENKNSTRIEAIKKEGKRSMYLSFLLVIISLTVLVFFIREAVPVYFFVLYGVIGGIMCLYTMLLQKLIESVDFATMSILKASASIQRYRKHLIIFSFAGSLVALFFVGTFLYVYSSKQASTNGSGLVYYLKPALMIVFVFIISRYSLWKDYISKINEIQRNLTTLKHY